MSTLIVFSHLRWNFVYQRPQHLLSRLARDWRVLFVEEPVHDQREPHFERIVPGDNVEVLRPHTPITADGFHDDQLPVLSSLLEETLREQGIDDYAVWFYTPMALPLLQGLSPTKVIYDCMDELSHFRNAPRQLLQRENALLKVADVVFTGGPSLYNAKKDRHANVHCFSSSVDAAHFAPRDGDVARAAVEAAQQEIPRPRLGFFGVIDERLDTRLIDAVAAARPEWQLVMVGPVVKIDPASLPQRPNIHWLGPRTYEELPVYTAGWDVCLMPFALNESTKFISPTKTLEYMAAEKPIVSTPITDVVEPYGGLVWIAADATGFVEACEQALAETGEAREVRIERMRQVVAGTSWDRTAERMGELIDAAGSAGRDPAAQGLLSGGARSTAPLATAGSAGGSLQRGVPHWRQVVLGAGPTGLSAAYHLGQGSLLIEREQRVGGWCRSIEDGGFTFDYAGHIMFSNDPYVLQLYDKLLGDNLHWQDREAWVYSKNVYTRYPFQGALYGLPPKVLKECIIGAIEARFGPLKGKGPAQPVNDKPPANFEEFIYRVWGAGVAKHFAIPYNQKIWAVPLSEMETSWLGGRVPLPDLEQMIEGALEPVPKPMGPNARFGYPLKGGFQALMDAFVPHLRGDMWLGTTMTSVSPRNRTLTLSDGRKIGYDTLVSTVPLPKLVAALGEEAPDEIVAASKGLRHTSIRCVNIGVGRSSLTDKHWIYYPEDTVFHRIFVQGNASPNCNPPGGFGLTCEISYSPSKPLPCEGEALIKRCIEDCIRVGMIRPDDKILVANEVDMPIAYVVYDHARAKNVALVRDWLAKHDIVLAGRYSEWEYYNSDHAFVAGKRAAEAISKPMPTVSVVAGGAASA